MEKLVYYLRSCSRDTDRVGIAPWLGGDRICGHTGHVCWYRVCRKDKERVTVRSGDDPKEKYLVFTENETFENTDSTLFWKFNSSDVQGQLDRGKSYRVLVAGWRISFLSSYRNIIEIE